MAALPTICLSALKSLIHGPSSSSSLDATAASQQNMNAPSSSSSSSGLQLMTSSNAAAVHVASTSTSRSSVDDRLYYSCKEADEKNREVEYMERDYEFAGLQRFGRVSLVALAAASLCYSAPGPAFAFRGGGPYGQEVTRGQDLTGRDFSGQTLIKQDFKTSILRQANFKGAKLLGSSFFDSDLTGADLTDADLRGCDFSLANVQKANLTNANLEGALVTGNTSFKNTIITGADFTEVGWRDDQRKELCKVADGTNPVTGNETRETLLCDY